MSNDGLCEVCRLSVGVTGASPGQDEVGTSPANTTPIGAPDGISEWPSRTPRDSSSVSVGPEPGAVMERLPPLEDKPQNRDVPVAPPGYRLLHRLGGGGMGDVYLAWEIAPERHVAIKFLKGPIFGPVLDRSRVEVRSMANIDHPNVVKVIAIDLDWSRPFFTMEYVPGGTLADLVRKGCPPVDPREAARLVSLAAEGVAACHVRGVLHRDLKPNNILLVAPPEPDPTPSPLVAADPTTAFCSVLGAGTTITGANQEAVTTDFTVRSPTRCPPLAVCGAKVADFGLAKWLERDDGLTTGNGWMGTPHYLSPEYAEGRVDEVSWPVDVYGLGATLYHLLTGRQPFSRGGSDKPDQTELVRRVLQDPLVRPRALRPDIPLAVEAIVLKAMERDLAKRYATAGELIEELQKFLKDDPHDPPKAPQHTRWRRLRQRLKENRRRLAMGLAGMVIAVGLLGAGMMIPSRDSPTQETTQPVTWEQARADLAAGQKVVLVGPTGLPKYPYRWIDGETSLTESPVGDHACSFNAFGYSLLELCPDPGVDKYTVDLEISQLLPAPGTVIPRSDWVGFYFGFSQGFTLKGDSGHMMFAVTYKDYAGPPAPNDPKGKPAVRGCILGKVQQPPRLFDVDSVKLDARPFVPSPHSVPTWRAISVDVSDAEIHIRWREKEGIVTLARWQPATLRAQCDRVKSHLSAKLAPETVTLPDWGPRMPFGIVSDRSSVAIRNVVLH